MKKTLVQFTESVEKLGMRKSSAMRAHGKNQDAIQMFSELQTEVRNCVQCDLSEQCRGPVPGYGPTNADMMILAEAPGEDEDEHGQPLIGDSGRFMTLMLNRLKQDRRNIYLSNAVKCRPPGNRTPTEDEIKACRFHLLNEICWIQPKVILTMGNVPMHTIRNDYDLKITKERGIAIEMTFRDVKPIVIHTFHPSFVLRQEHDPAKFQAATRMMYTDMKKAFQFLERR